MWCGGGGGGGQLETLSGEDLGSRLCLNCTPSRLPHLAKFDQRHITMIDATDLIVLPQAMRDGLYKRFATAKFALMKSGGDFPFLSNGDEVSMLLQVHLRAHGVFPDLNANSNSKPNPAPAPASAASSATSSAAATAPSTAASEAGSEPAPAPAAHGQSAPPVCRAARSALIRSLHHTCNQFLHSPPLPLTRRCMQRKP
jgi:hypothetical protein